MSIKFKNLNNTIVKCKKCPRLVKFIKKITILLFCITVLFQANGQVIDGLHDKLFDQYLLGKYADCHDKAQKMIASDKYKYDPEPYLYVSMCLAKLLEDPEQADERDNILKDALKFAEKSKKYHVKALKKEITTFPMDENLDYFDELIMIGIDEAKYHFFEDKFSKSASWFKKVGKVAPEDDNIQFAMASNMLLSRNMEGQKIMNDLLPRMKENYSNGDEPHLNGVLLPSIIKTDDKLPYLLSVLSPTNK